jgi:hypothetical protein
VSVSIRIAILVHISFFPSRTFLFSHLSRICMHITAGWTWMWRMFSDFSYFYFSRPSRSLILSTLNVARLLIFLGSLHITFTYITAF